MVIHPEGRGFAAAEPARAAPVPGELAPCGGSQGEVCLARARSDLGVCWVGMAAVSPGSHPPCPCPASATLFSWACWAKQREGRACWCGVTVLWLATALCHHPGMSLRPLRLPQAAPGSASCADPLLCLECCWRGSALHSLAGARQWHR